MEGQDITTRVAGVQVLVRAEAGVLTVTSGLGHRWVVRYGPDDRLTEVLARLLRAALPAIAQDAERGGQP